MKDNAFHVKLDTTPTTVIISSTDSLEIQDMSTLITKSLKTSTTIEVTTPTTTQITPKGITDHVQSTTNNDTVSIVTKEESTETPNTATDIPRIIRSYEPSKTGGNIIDHETE